MIDLEVLSPAGSIDSFFSAINNGADAVYLGLSKFNARAKSQDFTVENIREYVKIAHLFGVKVYVTLNTIVTQNELKDLVLLVKKAVNAKVDAFIVQDLGVAKLLKESFKNIVLHASTQMGIHNLEGALVAKELGFSRIVLSRETTLEDIKQIRKNTDLEIEYFVQGALCVAFSGACYFSSLKHNKSGNRGECLQLCRLCYEAKAKNFNKKGYFLSPTDLCFVENLQTLVDAGVTSFKIEGRLRRASYVAVATREYVKAKLKLQSKSNMQLKAEERSFASIKNSYTISDKLDKNSSFENSKQLLQKVFFRGKYNDGLYLNGEPNINIINSEYQNHRGILIGEVVKIKPFKDIFEIVVKTSNYEISKNDGLKFVDKLNNEISLGVGSVKKDKNAKNTFYIYSKARPKENSKVYLTVDSKWEEKILQTQKKIFFDAFFEGQVGKAPTLTIKCGKVQVKESLENFVCQSAKTQGLTIEEITSSLQKTQDTYFCVQNVGANLDNVFLPKSQLNELRRRAINSLYEKTIHNFEQKNCPEVYFDEDIYKKLINFEIDNTGKQYNVEHLTKDDKNYQPINKTNVKQGLVEQDYSNQNFVVVNEKTTLQDVVNSKFEDVKTLNIVISPSVFSTQSILSLINIWQDKVNKIYLDLPRVLSNQNKSLITEILDILPKEIGLVANNIYGLNFAQSREVIGGASLNIANNLSALVLKDFNVKNFVKSFEYFAGNFGAGLCFEGKPALMTFCHCPYKTCYKNGDCKSCKFDNSLEYISQDDRHYNIRRIKLNSCIFELVDSNTKIGDNFPKFIDLRWQS